MIDEIQIAEEVVFGMLETLYDSLVDIWRSKNEFYNIYSKLNTVIKEYCENQTLLELNEIDKLEEIPLSFFSIIDTIKSINMIVKKREPFYMGRQKLKTIINNLSTQYDFQKPKTFIQ